MTHKKLPLVVILPARLSAIIPKSIPMFTLKTDPNPWTLTRNTNFPRPNRPSVQINALHCFESRCSSWNLGELRPPVSLQGPSLQRRKRLCMRCSTRVRLAPTFTCLNVACRAQQRFNHCYSLGHAVFAVLEATPNGFLIGKSINLPLTSYLTLDSVREFTSKSIEARKCIQLSI